MLPNLGRITVMILFLQRKYAILYFDTHPANPIYPYS